MLSEYRDMAAAQVFFRSAKSVTGQVPNQVTTDGHGSYPQAIRSTLGRRVVHRSSAYKNNRLEQDHHGVKAAFDVCAASGASNQNTGSAEATTNFATCSALKPATTSTSLPTAVACFTFVVQPLRLPFSGQRRRDVPSNPRRQVLREC